MNIRNLLLSATALSMLSCTLLADSTLGERSTRLDSMELNNYMTKDGFNMFFNPANVASNKTSAFLELGLNDNGGATAQDSTENVNGFAGVIFNAGVAGNYGVVLNRYNSSLNNFTNSNDVKQNNIDLFYGLAITNDFNIGMRLTYASLNSSDNNSSADLRVQNSSNSFNQTNNDTLSNDYNEEASDTTISLGTQIIGIDAVVTYGLYSYNETTQASLKNETFQSTALDSQFNSILSANETTDITSDSASLLEVALAYTYNFNEKSSLIGYGIYSATDYSVTGSNTRNSKLQTGNNNTVTNQNFSNANSRVIDGLKVGASYNLKPIESVLLVLAAEYTNRKETIGYSANVNNDTSIFTDTSVNPTTSLTTNNPTGEVNTADDREISENDFSVVIATEAKVLDSLALRFGLRESIYYNRDDSYNNNLYDTTFNNVDAVDTGDNQSTATSNTVKDAQTDESTYQNIQNNMQVAIGFGYAATEAISIDGLVNANVFLTGPNFLSGEKLTNINARLALRYNF